MANCRNRTTALTESSLPKPLLARISLTPPHKLLLAFSTSIAIHAAILLSLIASHAHKGNETALHEPLSKTSLEVQITPPRQQDNPPPPAHIPTTETPRSQAAAPRPMPAANEEQIVYYSSQQLTYRPQFITPPAPQFPQREEHFSGNAVLRLLLDEEGGVTSATIIKSKFNEKENLLLIDAFKALRFKPGEIDGKAVATQMDLEFGFDNGKPPKPNP